MELREISRSEFLEEFKHFWIVGQHVTLVGTTGSGKTVLARDLCDLRRYVVVIASKAKDESLDKFPKSFHRIKKWPPEFHQEKVVFWKKPGNLGDFNDQRTAFYYALQDIYKSGGWTVYFDDIFYLAKTLKLDNVLQMLYTQVRSQGVSLLGSIQRPAWVPLEVVNQASHVLVFGLKDDKDIERVSKEQGVRKYEVVKSVEMLRQYEFVWIRTGMKPVIVRNDKE